MDFAVTVCEISLRHLCVATEHLVDKYGRPSGQLGKIVDPHHAVGELGDHF
jgi:hypothetical protein